MKATHPTTGTRERKRLRSSIIVNTIGPDDSFLDDTERSRPVPTYSSDELCRDGGFSVVLRPDGQPSTWARGLQAPIPQGDVLAIVERENDLLFECGFKRIRNGAKRWRRNKDQFTHLEALHEAAYK